MRKPASGDRVGLPRVDRDGDPVARSARCASAALGDRLRSRRGAGAARAARADRDERPLPGARVRRIVKLAVDRRDAIGSGRWPRPTVTA